MNAVALVRIALGFLFVISGGEKLLSPPENFLYVIEGYDLLSSPLARLVAHTFPWLELATGLLIAAGLWLRWALCSLLAISLVLLGVVGQALVRHLPLSNCGCFGELIHLPLHGVILLDVGVLLLTLWCLRALPRASACSLDAWRGAGK